MDSTNQEKTAFITEDGLYYYKVMSFGFKNAGATYQQLVNKIFSNKIGRTMEVYVDDMMVKSLTVEQHINDLADTFASLQLYNIRLNLEKYIFRVEVGKFLGYMISRRGIKANLEKIKAILDMPSPRSVKHIQMLVDRMVALS